VSGYKRVLAATDESEQGAHAVDIACTIARNAGAVFDVVTVRAARRVPALTSCEISAPCLTAVMELHGLPSVEVVHYAESSRADLLVLGRSPRSRAAPAMLGATPDGVIRRRLGPTVMVPRNVTHVERVLVALDGSRRGLGVLGPGTEFARIMGAELSVVCVLPEAPGALRNDDAWVDPRRARVLQTAAETGNGAGPIHTIISTGEPVRQILQTFEDLRCDVLVLGVRGGGPPGELGSGHVGRDVLRASPGAVLTVPI
jgi:nucleotide-binding universal stress UspA family protein